MMLTLLELQDPPTGRRIFMPYLEEMTLRSYTSKVVSIARGIWLVSTGYLLAISDTV